MGTNQSLLKFIVLMTLVGLLLLLSINIFTRYATTEPATQPGVDIAEYPGPETPVIWEVQVLRKYEEALRRDDLSPEMRSSLETKIAIYSRIATEIEISRHITRTPEPVVT